MQTRSGAIAFVIAIVARWMIGGWLVVRPNPYAQTR